MSRIKKGKTDYFEFRKPKFKKRSPIRRAVWVAKMISISNGITKKIEEKRKNGTLITKRFEYGDSK